MYISYIYIYEISTFNCKTPPFSYSIDICVYTYVYMFVHMLYMVYMNVLLDKTIVLFSKAIFLSYIYFDITPF